MVQRKEVDFAYGNIPIFVIRINNNKPSTSGPFTLTLDRTAAVDFTHPAIESYHGVVVPLQHRSKMWYIADPFTYYVWLLTIVVIPLYIIAMGFGDYIYHGSVQWDKLSGFIIRNALSEQNSSLPNNSNIYQKIFIITWVWSIIVLVNAYSGNLTAMLAKPALKNPISTLEGLISQNKIELAIEKGTTAEYLSSTAEAGSTLKKLYERATIVPLLSAMERMKYGCYMKPNVASLCALGDILTSMSYDFTLNGNCNYYLLEELILPSKASHFAVQVVTINILRCPSPYRGQSICFWNSLC